MGIRSEIQKRNRFVAPPRGQGVKPFLWVCLLSFGIHLLCFASVFIFHDFSFSAPTPRVVRVDLVSFSPGPVGGAVAPEAPEMPQAPSDPAQVNVNPEPVQPPPVDPAPVPVLQPEVSLKSKPRNIKELMAEQEKQEKKPEKKLEKKKEPEPKPKPKPAPKPDPQKAAQELARKQEQEKQEQLSQAFKRMEQAIAAKESRPGSAVGEGEGTGPGARTSDRLLLYQLAMKSAIEQNWVFNDVMARMNKNLEVRIFIKILKSGEIRDISYETRSGNQYLDESAKRAIRRAGPFPELPQGMNSYDVVVGFSPRGIK